ncbi:MAG: hypothetical protein ACREIT_07080 [Tepidisphaeraceae bacterium]
MGWRDRSYAQGQDESEDDDDADSDALSEREFPDESDMDDADQGWGPSEITIACPYCGEQVFEEAQRCPYCERYRSEEDAPRRMRRKGTWLIVGVIIATAITLLWIAVR